MTPRELDLCHKGYETRRKEAWEHTRLLATYSIIPHAKKGSNINVKVPTDGEKRSKYKEITPDMIAKVYKIDGSK
jgi:hypothetical protein